MQLTSPNMQMKHKLENNPNDIVSFRTCSQFQTGRRDPLSCGFLFDPILANDSQAEEIPEYAENWRHFVQILSPHDAPGKFRAGCRRSE
jgi:hypothetical protein